MSRPINCIIVVMSLFLVGCSRTHEMTGEVFIVTKAGESVKLGLVEVVAVPDKTARQCVDKNHAVWSEAYQKARKDLTDEQDRHDKLSADFRKSEAHIDQHKELASVTRSILQNRELYTTDVLTAAYNDYMENKKQWDKELITRNDLRKLMDDSIKKTEEPKRLLSVFENGSFMVECFNSEIMAKSTTNADGRFSMQLPKEPVVIFALSRRELPGGIEEYYWFVSAQPSTTHLMLSNNNLYTSKCQECITAKLDDVDNKQSE